MSEPQPSSSTNLRRRLHIWQSIAAILAVAFAVMVFMNWKQRNDFNTWTRKLVESEIRKDESYRAIVEEIRKAFEPTDDSQFIEAERSLNRTMEEQLITLPRDGQGESDAGVGE